MIVAFCQQLIESVDENAAKHFVAARTLCSWNVGVRSLVSETSATSGGQSSVRVPAAVYENGVCMKALKSVSYDS